MHPYSLLEGYAFILLLELRKNFRFFSKSFCLCYCAKYFSAAFMIIIQDFRKTKPIIPVDKYPIKVAQLGPSGVNLYGQFI